MTDDEARIIRATAVSVLDVLAAAARVADRAATAWSGNDVAIVLERAGNAICEMQNHPDIIALRDAGIPPSLLKR